MSDQTSPVEPSNAQPQSRYKTNPWMVSTLVLVGIVVGIGVGQLSMFEGGGDSAKTASLGATGGSPSEIPSQPSESTPEEYEKLSAALVDDDTAYGDKDAPVTVIEFSDFQCPFCAASAGASNAVYERLKGSDSSWEPIVPKLLATYVKEGKVRFIYRDFPLDGHPQAIEAAEAAECADEQGKFLEMHDQIFAGTADWGSDDEKAKQAFKKYAKALGLDTAKFNDCLDSGKMKPEIQKDYQDGVRAGVSGTPTFFVNGRQISGAQSFSAMASLVESLLKE